MVGAALEAGAPVEALYFSPEARWDPRSAELLERAAASGTRTFELTPGVLERVADAATPQPVMAVVRSVDVGIEALYQAGLVVVCSGVRDPGNAGTVLRSADAAGAGGVIMCDDSVDLYNPKAVRASAGALFQVPVVVADSGVAVLSELRGAGFRCLGAAARGGTSYTDEDLTGRLAIVFGSESAGLAPEVQSMLEGRVTVPMSGSAESLNVAMAVSVVCFEVARQRRRSQLRAGAADDHAADLRLPR